MTNLNEQNDAADRILAAIEELRAELAARDEMDAARTEAMDDLREELRKERLRRQFLWTPIGILAALLMVVTMVFVNDRQQDARYNVLLCEQTNASRSTVAAFLDEAKKDMDPARAEYLTKLADKTLSPRDCSKAG